jgi:hypothetical protein
MSQLKAEGVEHQATHTTRKRKLNEAEAEDAADTVLLNTLLGHKTLNKKIRFPIDDKVYWDFKRSKGAKIPPLPLPYLSKQLTSSKDTQVVDTVDVYCMQPYD